MKKICILTCGGTITMKKDKKGVLIPFHKSNILLQQVPFLNKIAQIKIEEVTNIDSTNMKPSLWTKLAHLIEEHYHNFDSFIITHGTDTMAYTASALSFALRNLNKPVIFTGSQKPIDDIPTDAGNNLINSILLATKDLAGVCIVFGSKILRGNRATKISESSLDAFESPMVLPIGEISLEPKLTDSYKKKQKNNLSLFCQADFDENIIIAIITPGLNSAYLEKIVDDCKGIILAAFGPGNIPDTLLPFFQKARKLSLPVIILSQCQKGITQMQLYKVGQQALKAGAIPGNDMTIEAASAKLMWILAQTKDIRKIGQAFNKSYSGEVTIH